MDSIWANDYQRSLVIESLTIKTTLEIFMDLYIKVHGKKKKPWEEEQESSPDDVIREFTTKSGQQVQIVRNED